MKLNLSTADWLKLKSYNEIISKEVQKKLPSDWQLSIDEISSYVYDTFFRLSKNFKQGECSFTSYCYKYAKLCTLNVLFREYNKLKNQQTLFDIEEPEEDDYIVKHQIVEYDISNDKDDEQVFYTKLFCNELLEKMNETDRHIAESIMNGHSYDEIAKELGTNKMEISRRMRKYSFAS